MYDRLMELYGQLAAGGTPSPLAYALIFTGGIVSGASPCYVPVLALFAGYVGGYARGVRELVGVKTPNVSERAVGHASHRLFGLAGLRLAIPFIAGNAVSLAVVGALASLIGASVLTLFTGYQLDRWIPGLVGLLMGLHLLGLLQLRLPEIPVPASLRNWRPRTEWGAFSLGVPFGVVVTPCAIPLFAAVVAFVAFQAGVLHGALLMVAYALGRGLILATVAVSAGLLRRLEASRTALPVRRASGILLVAVSLGLLLLYDAYRDWIMPMPDIPVAVSGAGDTSGSTTAPRDSGIRSAPSG